MSYDLPVSQICALMVLSSMASVLVANSTPMVDLESRLNSLRVNLDRTVDEAFEMVGVCGHSFERTIPVGRVASSSVRSCAPRASRRSTHDFPTPESPIRTTCHRFWVCNSVPTFPGMTATDLEEEIKVAAFRHGCESS